MSSNPLSDEERETLNRLHKYAKEGNYYQLLDIRPTAPAKEVQAAFYRMSRDWHPDRHFRRQLGDDGARIEFVFVNVTKAYKTLSNDDTRRRYHRDNRELVAKLKADSRGATQDTKDPTSSTRVERAAASEKRRTPEEVRKRTEARLRRHEEAARRSSGARKSGDPRKKAVRRMREQVQGHSSRAQQYFRQGQEDYAAGNVSKAVASLHLAVQFDPDNAEYRALYELARSEASSSLAVQFVQAGEAAESFQNYKEAMFNYQRACDQDPDDGLPYFRLAKLVLRVEQDTRTALNHLRTASLKSPKNVEIRLSLADLYAELGMQLNAKREYQTVLTIDKNNTRARDGLRSVR